MPPEEEDRLADDASSPKNDPEAVEEGSADRNSLKPSEDVKTSEEHTQMLDFFPFHHEELIYILSAQSRVADILADSGESNRSFSDLFESTIYSESDHCSMEAVDFAERRRYVEKEFLSESPLLLKEALECVFLLGSGHDQSPIYEFLEAVAILLGRRSARNVLTVLFRVAATVTARDVIEKDVHSSTDPTVSFPAAKPADLASLIYRLVLAGSYLRHGQPTLMRQYPRAWSKSLADRSFNNQSGLSFISLPDWLEWVQSVAPHIEKTLSTFCHYAIFGPRHPFRSTDSCLSLPVVINEDTKSALWTFPYQGVPASLAVVSTALGGPWIQLYSSDTDGCSFRALQESLLSYYGTTVVLIQTTAGDVFGYYSDCPWKESKRWYGYQEASNSFLFGLKPSLQYFPPTNTSTKPYHMFLHNPIYSHPTDLNGLAIGGIDDKTPRIHITTNFEHCKAGSMDEVYEAGPLLSGGEIFFDIDVIELYAVGCTAGEFETGLFRGIVDAEVREGARLKAAKVDRKQFLEDFQTGQYMNKAFAHRDQTRGRHSFVAHEDGSSGYFVDSKAPSKRQLKLDDDDQHD